SADRGNKVLAEELLDPEVERLLLRGEGNKLVLALPVSRPMRNQTPFVVLLEKPPGVAAHEPSQGRMVQGEVPEHLRCLRVRKYAPPLERFPDGPVSPSPSEVAQAPPSLGFELWVQFHPVLQGVSRHRQD